MRHIVHCQQNLPHGVVWTGIDIASLILFPVCLGLARGGTQGQEMQAEH
jgi:hypothetical protein